MDSSLLLSLRFQQQRQSTSCLEIAAIFEELESLYLAVPRAIAREEPLLLHLGVERRSRLEHLLGDSGIILGEIEYRTRALRRLEQSGAPEGALLAERASIDLLARLNYEQTAFGARRTGAEESRSPGRALEVRRMSMRSPLVLDVVIPSQYWIAGGGFFAFLRAVERSFNMVGRIKVERKALEALEASADADRRDAEARQREGELRTMETERAIAELRGLASGDLSDTNAHDDLLQDLGPSQDQFELEGGVIDVDRSSNRRSRRKQGKEVREAREPE